jgi:hypothetical protein
MQSNTIQELVVGVGNEMMMRFIDTSTTSMLLMLQQTQNASTASEALRDEATAAIAKAQAIDIAA